MRFVARMVAAVSGVILLALIAPHRNPWEMRWLPNDSATLFAELPGRSMAIPLWVVVVLCAAVILTPLAVSCRPNAMRHPPSPSRRNVILLGACAALLAVSLIPGAPRGRGVVINTLLGSAGIALLAWSLAVPSVTRRFEKFGRAAARGLRAWPALVVVAAAFLLVFLAANLGSYFLLGHVPHVVDAADQLFHARIFLSGKLVAPAPDPEVSFRFTHMISGDRWYSQYPPGHTLLLALALLVHAPWLLNPLLGGLSVVLFYFIGREAFDESTGRWSALFGALSPFVWIMSSSHMSHATALFFLCLFLLGFVRMLQAGGMGSAVLAGAAAGVALTARPMTAAAFAAPFAIYAFGVLIRRISRGETRGEGLRLAGRCAVAAAAFAIPLGALAAFNSWTNGDPLLFGYQVLHGKQALPGFGNSGWWGEPHTPWRGIAHMLSNLNAMNRYLFGLPLPSLALPLLALAAPRRARWDWLLGASVASLVTAHVFYWYQDLAYGPRFLYSAVGPLVLLSARAVTRLPVAAERWYPRRQALGVVGLVMALAFVYGWAVNVPVLAGFYARNYYGVYPDVARTVDAARLTQSVVFVPDLYYASLFPRNDPLLDGDVVYARDLGPARNRAVASNFPGRSFYRIRSYDAYELARYEPSGALEVAGHEVAADAPFELEALTFQLSYLDHGTGRDLGTGELGRGWSNHDQLWVSSEAPGSETGFILHAGGNQTRTLTVRVTRSPDSGIAEIRINGSVLLSGIDLYARRLRADSLKIAGVPLRAGPNGLLFRVIDKNPSSRGYGMGLDTLRLD